VETGKLVWLMKGSPIYEELAKIGGGTTRHYVGYIPEVTMGIEVERVEEMGVEHPGQSEARAVRWSQVLVDGRLVWTRTVLLMRQDGVIGVPLC
jgi:hypothetical protein